MRLNMMFDYQHAVIGQSVVIHADCLDWLGRVGENSIHGIVTDPPYGVKEYQIEQLEKMLNGDGGTWRIPPTFDGANRRPLPRFTALSRKERAHIHRFLVTWGKLVKRVLRPGGHLFIATNTFLSQLVFHALAEAGLEFRGQLIRLVRTFRGGDRPKNAEKEFSLVSSMPRSCHEPWGIFRKPLPKRMRVADCLREFRTGGLRRISDDKPFCDVIESGRTPRQERQIAPHPSLKPQDFLRQLVHAVLPLGEGIILDPFMGSGSTIAAAEAMGLQAIGIERYADYYQMSLGAIPQLTALQTEYSQPQQLSFF